MEYTGELKDANKIPVSKLTKKIKMGDDEKFGVLANGRDNCRKSFGKEQNLAAWAQDMSSKNLKGEIKLE